MTPEEINKTIAKHVGWYVITPPAEDGTTAFRLCHPKETTVYPWCESEEEAFTHAPDYFNDFNAMHDAVNTLPYNKRGEYVRRIDCIYRHDEYRHDGEGFTDTSWSWIYQLLHAKAAQRAEAFLKTLRLWKD